MIQVILILGIAGMITFIIALRMLIKARQNTNKGDSK